MRLITTAIILMVSVSTSLAEEPSRRWKRDWPQTDFSTRSVDLRAFVSGGPRKDEIPSINLPQFRNISEADLKNDNPVISVEINGSARAYPISMLLWHEIANDTLGGVPIAVTYCPLCNSGVVYIRRVKGEITTFGTTGLLRNSDLVMYDRLTESWWQQFTGEALLGEMTGAVLKIVPARTESVALFAKRHPDGQIMTSYQAGMPYGTTPYAHYDKTRRPIHYQGNYSGPVPAMARVVAVGDQAWSLDLLRKEQEIVSGDLVISYITGQNSPLDSRKINRGRDIGNVVVRRRLNDGFADVAHDIPFAFAFLAFNPGGTIHH